MGLTDDLLLDIEMILIKLYKIVSDGITEDDNGVSFCTS
jgi:hypothetical protein